MRQKLHHNVIDITNKRFGRLLVQYFAYSNKRRQAMWGCICICGNKKIISGTHLIHKRIRSCGCYAKDLLIKRNYIHGFSKLNEYNIWVNINKRCYDKKHHSYINYGGRGILVCNRWKLSFKNFLSDMGNRPSKNHSIDRINNNGNYEPSNCRWTTSIVQSNNKRNTIKYIYNNKLLSITEIATLLNINRSYLYNRLKKWNDLDLFLSIYKNGAFKEIK